MSLGRNTAWNIAGNALPLLVGAVTIPMLIPKLGIERFGILTLLWAIIGYFSLFDFGIGRAVTQQIASASGAGRHNEIPQIIKAGLEFTALTGIAGGTLLAVLAYTLSQSGLGVSEDLKTEVFWSLIVAAAGIPLATVSNGLRGALEGYERFDTSNFARMLLGTSIFLFPYFSVILHGASLVTVTVWLVGARALSCILFAWFVARLPGTPFWQATIAQGTRSRLFAFGAWMAITNLVSPILVNADRFFISFVLGAAWVAYYTVPFEFLVRLLILPGALGASLLPAMARHRTVDFRLFDASYRRGVKIIALFMFPLCSIAVMVAYPLMETFISPDFAAKSWLLVGILSVGVFLNSIAYMPYTALHALGSARQTGVLHIAELVVYIPVLLVLINVFGLTGAALAWTLRTGVDAIALHFLYSKEKLRHV